MLNLPVEIVELQERRKIFLDTNRAAVVEHCIVRIVPISLLNQEMILSIIFPKNTVFQDLQ